MALIRNRLNQRLIINLSEGKNIDLQVKGRVNASEKDRSSCHLQDLLSKGDIALVQMSESWKVESVVQTNASKKSGYFKEKRLEAKTYRGKDKTKTYQK